MFHVKQNQKPTENTQTQVQKAIFEEIKNKLKTTDVSLVDDLALLLSVSTDSAYRRIRCDKFVTIDELEKICKHYRISYDKHLAHLNENNVVFRVALQKETLSFDNFLAGILHEFKTINAQPDHEFIYSAKDIPIFHFFQIPELAAFKMFYWMKTVFQMPEYDNVSFSMDFIAPKYMETAKQIGIEYINTTTHEIWNYESIHSILAQIEFYFDSGYLEKSMALTLLDKLKDLMLHLKKQADLEFKFPIKGVMPEKKRNYFLYNNEIILGDNTMYSQFGSETRCYIPHAILYYMTTADEKYCAHIHEVFSGLINRSVMISGTAERQRAIFFNYILQRIEDKKTKLQR